MVAVQFIYMKHSYLVEAGVCGPELRTGAQFGVHL